MLVIPALIHLLPGGTKTVHRLMKHFSQTYTDELVPASLPFVATEPERCEITKEPTPSMEFL